MPVQLNGLYFSDYYHGRSESAPTDQLFFAGYVGASSARPLVFIKYTLFDNPMAVQMNGLSLSEILWNAEGGVPYKNIHAEYPFTNKCDFFETPMPVNVNGLYYLDYYHGRSESAPTDQFIFACLCRGEFRSPACFYKIYAFLPIRWPLM